MTILNENAPDAENVGRSVWFRIALIAVACAVAAFIPGLLPNLFYVHIVNLTLLSGIFALSLWVIYSVGQLSLCHAAFAGLGAYISAIISMRLNIPPALSLVLSTLATAALAAALGAVILRLRGVYFVLVTFLFGQMFTLLALNWAGMTNGANGLIGIKAVTLFGISFGPRPMFFYLAFAMFLMVLVFVWALNRSTFGRAFNSIEQNINLAETCGIDTARYQVIAFAIGSGIAGLGGALMAHYIRFISPDTFTFHNSVAYITMLVVGGRSLFWGAVLGAAFLTPLPEFLRDFEGLQHIIYGAIMIVVLRVMPGGLISLPRTLARIGGAK
ncbi:amino acid/amide ABC transporter membrane protein 2, HAAT family [Roseovarius pacificus]|uniref:Amino acid/amide ABC transporter membrane protein 2, HAAT family n=1 Tax=Roseovarius pacificus TaxID=337701 RepID=A0A1M7GZG7_9RHOB|nr:branched-chain amino acid ABC transporter permease [Roseovarius pacificus]GGO60076.1 branched-chain amino acid ABC transporter permease [Roseovarius pacificus]SHM21518.1 amino acid/amide ABC transporter membrane protein 2, HAAT family [Roseovarius pacificus]